MTSNKSAIVLVVDRLSAGMLGPYGNTWLETPHLNQLASQSVLFDFAISDSITLEKTLRSYWTGLHAIASADPGRAAPSLPELLSRQGTKSILVTDDEKVDRFTLSDHFSNRLRCHFKDATNQQRRSKTLPWHRLRRRR